MSSNDGYTKEITKGQIWQANDGTRARVLRYNAGSLQTGNRRSRTSMTGSDYVRYFNLKTRRQSEARWDTFVAKFPRLVEGEGAEA